VSTPQQQASTPPALTAGRLLPDGRRLYRLPAPQAVWWVWVVLALASLGDLVIQGHDYLSLKFAFGLLTVTGLVYSCTLWPRVTADDSGLRVQNPIRTFMIPWNAVRGIFLADSVEIQCTRGQAKKDKTVYSWALSSARRGRARAKLHGWQWEQGKRNRPSNYGQLPGQAKELVKMTATEVMARELAKLSEEAKLKSAEASLGDIDLGDADLGDANLGGSSLTKPGANGTSEGASSDAGNSPIGTGKNGTSQAGSTGSAQTGSGSVIATGAVLIGTWSWPALAAFLVPGVAFAIVMLVG